MADTTPIPFDPQIRLLLCLACERTVVCGPDDLLRYTKAGWPRCCGEVMSLFTPTPLPPTPPKTNE